MSTVTAPSVPSCLVITLLPSAAISAIGNPGRSSRGISVKNAKFPPVAWQPHSITCPAATAPASASYSSRSQPWCAAAGPTITDASVTRPVTTTSAPSRSASAIPQAPRYAFAASGFPNPSSSARSSRSSPSTYAILGASPSRPASSPIASASPAGFSPPALLTIFTPRSSARPSPVSSCRRNVFAYPSRGSFSRSRPRISIVSSAR